MLNDSRILTLPLSVYDIRTACLSSYVFIYVFVFFSRNCSIIFFWFAPFVSLSVSGPLFMKRYAICAPLWLMMELTLHVHWQTMCGTPRHSLRYTNTDTKTNIEWRYKYDYRGRERYKYMMWDSAQTATHLKCIKWHFLLYEELWVDVGEGGIEKGE